MKYSVRDGKFDLVVVAGPNVDPWPTVGVRALTSLAAEYGLKAGVIGGESLRARGVIPLPGTGGVVFAEDVQNRIHRLHARAVVRLTRRAGFPDPFPGWTSSALVPLQTVNRLLRQSVDLHWDPGTVILGTGNRALRLGSRLLEAGCPEVLCVETQGQWGKKNYAGWEVEKRRFEMLGGRLIEAKPISLKKKSASLWEMRLQDQKGVRLVEVSRVVSAGPFSRFPAVREYPPGSLLFEIEQSSERMPEEDVQGWNEEEALAQLAAVKIIKALGSEFLTGNAGKTERERLEKVTRKARAALKRDEVHYEAPHAPTYQGKWTSNSDARQIRAFSGVPKNEQRVKAVASIECFEEISCNLCELACPENAIDMSRKDGPILNERDCSSCGACLNACPSGVPILIQEEDDHSLSKISINVRGKLSFNVGERAILLNRRGEALGSGRVVEQKAEEGALRVQVELPTHLVWEARGLRKASRIPEGEEEFAQAYKRLSFEPVKNQVEIQVNSEKRIVKDKIPLIGAFYEMGHARGEDALACVDGSCRLCEVSVDGLNKLSCQTEVHRGMTVKFDKSQVKPTVEDGEMLCPCLKIQLPEVVERIRQGKFSSPEALLSVVHVGEGLCHGQRCMEGFMRILAAEGMDLSQWIDWRFPSEEWTLHPVSRG